MKSYTQILLLASLASAHFTLDNPPAYGFDEDIEDQAPCGGFSTATSVGDWGSSGNNLQITSHHDSADVYVNWAPLNSTNFYPLFNFSLTGIGSVCFNDVVLPRNLTGATIQVVYEGGDGSLYQCGNVGNSNSTVEASGACSNGTGISAVYGGASGDEEMDGHSDDGHDHGSETNGTSSASTYGANSLLAIIVGGAFYSLA